MNVVKHVKRFLCPKCMNTVISDKETVECPKCKTMMIGEGDPRGYLWVGPPHLP